MTECKDRIFSTQYVDITLTPPLRHFRFDTRFAPLIFAEQFLQISTKLPSKYIYGFGEHEHASYLHDVNWKSYGMFTRDQYPKVRSNFMIHHLLYMFKADFGCKEASLSKDVLVLPLNLTTPCDS